jgi:hypothetical protein
VPRGCLAFVTGLLGVLLVTLSADASDLAPAPQSRVYVVDRRGSDADGVGSRLNPWRTLAKACKSVAGGLGDTIRVNPGTYTESDSCKLPCKTNLRGSGRAATTLKGRADPLVRVTNCMRRGNAQTISGVHLDGQNRTAGTVGMRVENVRGLTIRDMLSEGFKGTASGGALDVNQVWNVDVGDSTFRNSGAIFSNFASGTLGIRNATDSVFHDLVVYDSQALGVKGGDNGDTLTNVEFYNLHVTVGSSVVLSWPAISFEMNDMDVTTVTIRNSYFNATLSLTDDGISSPLASGFRYNIHNNDFDISPSSQTGGNLQYALELDQNSSEVHHNFFDGGVHAIANFESVMKHGNTVHHNVFDNQENWVALMYFRNGLSNSDFYKNTVVLRQSWWNSLFKLDETITTSSPVIRNNIFWSAYPIGDKLGTGLDASSIDRNDFYNVEARGKNPLVDDPELPLTGGFPEAYVPAAGSPAAALGAFARGTWSVGPVPAR